MTANNGLVVRLESACKCGAAFAAIDGASVRCAACGAYRDVLSHETQKFITEIARLVGRPTAPILIGHKGRQP
jgi:hypothetical protein